MLLRRRDCTNKSLSISPSRCTAGAELTRRSQLCKRVDSSEAAFQAYQRLSNASPHTSSVAEDVEVICFFCGERWGGGGGAGSA